MKLATVRIKKNSELHKGDKKRVSIESVVNEVNVLFESNLSHKTAVMYVRQGMINVSPQKRGPVGDFPKTAFTVLTWACATCLKPTHHRRHRMDREGVEQKLATLQLQNGQ